MLYPYQDKQTLCVTLEDNGDWISRSALQTFLFLPLLSVGIIAPFIVSWGAIMGTLWMGIAEKLEGQTQLSHDIDEIFKIPSDTVSPLAVIPFAFVGFAALIVTYARLRTRADENTSWGSGVAGMTSTIPFLYFGLCMGSRYLFIPREYALWRIFAAAFGAVLLTLLAFISYIISIKFIKAPSRFWTWVNRCTMAPIFLGTSASLYGVLSGDRWARELVVPMCVLLALSIVCLAAELSTQAYKGREVPVWRYKVENVMSAAILLTCLADMTFDFLPSFL